MIIVGAGCAGLSCARALVDAGHRPIVLEKSRGVGGRAATRRIDGQPIDHGVIFFHGSSPEFLAALDGTEATRLEGWPETIVGGGQACLPRAFIPGERRLAFAEGITAFPKSLARGVDVRRGTRVRSLVLREDHFELDVDGSESLATDTLALALPLEQTLSLVGTLPSSRELDGIEALLQMLATDPCLTLIAGYPLDAPVPDWDVLYPTESAVLLLVSQDSRKRAEKKFHAFVLQCSAAFSRRHLDVDPSSWVDAVLDEAGRLLGDWASNPGFTQTHRWRFGRANASPLSRPLLLRLPGGPTLGLAGELFEPALGVEAAFLSGRALASRIRHD